MEEGRRGATAATSSADGCVATSLVCYCMRRHLAGSRREQTIYSLCTTPHDRCRYHATAVNAVKLLSTTVAMTPPFYKRMESGAWTLYLVEKNIASTTTTTKLLSSHLDDATHEMYFPAPASSPPPRRAAANFCVCVSYWAVDFMSFTSPTEEVCHDYWFWVLNSGII